MTRFRVALGLAVAALGGCLAAPLRPGPVGVAAPAGDSADPGSAASSRAGIVGRVVDERNAPAAGVKVTAYPADAQILDGAGGGAYTDVGQGVFLRVAGLLEPGRWTLRSNAASAGAQSATTDEGGRFLLKPAATGSFNLEAVRDERRKAWAGAVSYLGPDLPVQAGVLLLGPVGAISGRVKATVESVSDFANTQVYIPGSSHVSVTGPEGAFTISGVPLGEFALRAFHPDLGDAELPNADYPVRIKVQADQATVVPTLTLALSPPELLRLTSSGTAEPTDNAGPGAIVDFHGKAFGFRRGSQVSALFTRSTPFAPERLSDTLLRVKVPADAASGQVGVAVGRQYSGKLPFRVIGRFALTRDTLSLSPGATADLGAYVEAFDTDGVRIAASPPNATVPTYRPNVSWAADSLRAGVDSAGILTAVSEGTVLLTATAGTLAARTLALTVGTGSGPGPTPTPRPEPSASAAPSPGPSASDAPQASPSPGAAQPAYQPGQPAPDDIGDPARHHDYVVAKDGVASTFVWIPAFTAYQLIVPAGAGLAHLPEGAWVADRPAAGARDVDWAEEGFGGFYAAKFEASRADASPGDEVTGAGATAGTSTTTLRVARYCAPWTNVTWAQAVAICKNYHPQAHLMADDEWTALAVWAMTRGGTVYGNNGQYDNKASPAVPRSYEVPQIRFVDDPTYAWSANGVDRALTGSGTSGAWAGTVDQTTHTGKADGVCDLNGNVEEWTANVGQTTDGEFTLDGAPTGVSAGEGFIGAGWLTALAVAPEVRRFGLPGATAPDAPGFFGDDFFFHWNLLANRATRGGWWAVNRGSGVWCMNLDTAPTTVRPSLGFRPALRF